MKTKEIFKYTLGALIALGTFVLIGMLVWLILYHPDSPLRDVLVMSIGALIAKFSTVVDFFYGSSKGSEDKTDLLNGHKQS
jgi:hypothetical protein